MSVIDPKTLNVYHFNRLTPTQAELLALISEESGEVVQIVGKILRHGLTSCHPDGGPQNSRLLEIEIGDLLAATRLIAADGMIDMVRVEDAADEKLRKVFKYLHHAPAQPEPEPKLCSNCGKLTRESHERNHPLTPHLRPLYTCQKPDREETFPNSGHGHVWPRPDGVKARCGGPGLCAVCSRDAAAMKPTEPEPKREEKVQAACDHCDNLALIERDGEKFCISCIPDDIRRKPATSPAPDECPTFSDGTPIFPGRVKTAPVAGELELPVRQALERLRFDAQGCFNAGSFRLAATIRSEADALETWARSQASPDSSDEDRAFDNGYAKGRLDEMARSQAQPVAVGMSEELEVVLRLAAQHVEGWRQLYQSPEYREQMLTAIAAVRAQAESAQPKTVPVEAIKILRNEWATGQMTEQACHEIDRWLAQVEGE